MATRRHTNGRYRSRNGSPGDGTGFELEKVYACERPEHALAQCDMEPDEEQQWYPTMRKSHAHGKE